jgi:hypothetical protein
MRRVFMNGMLLVAVMLCGAAHAADPEFQSTIVTDSRIYQKQTRSFSIAGIPGAVVGNGIDVSRVTVALDGVLVTGEWEPKTAVSTSAKDFRRGTDVLAAVSRNHLLLKLPDGDVVTAKIVSRQKQKTATSPPRDRHDSGRGDRTRARRVHIDETKLAPHIGRKATLSAGNAPTA